jgi:ribosomal protein L40E
MAIKPSKQKQSQLSSLCRAWQELHGKAASITGLYAIYKYYKEKFFTKLLEDTTISNEDREKIKGLLAKPFNPYIHRHSALTEKSTKLKSSTLEQYAGWVPGSTMQKRYVHYFGNDESSVDILEVYVMKVNDSISIDTLNPKICPNCNEGNTQDAKFCSKCKMLMSFDGYQEVLQEQQEKDKDLQSVKERMASIFYYSLLSSFLDHIQMH